jgi:hypothetical protein
MVRIKARSISGTFDELSGHAVLVLPWPGNVALNSDVQPAQLKVDLHERLIPFTQYGKDALRLAAADMGRYERLNHGYAFYSRKGDVSALAPQGHEVSLDIKVSAEVLGRIREGLLDDQRLEVEYAFEDCQALAPGQQPNTGLWDVTQDSPVVSLAGLSFCAEASIGELGERLEQLSRQVAGLPIRRLETRLMLLAGCVGVIAVLLGGLLVSRLF